MSLLQLVSTLVFDGDEEGPGDNPAPPGSPPTYKFEGPWFTTQLLLSTTIGLTSFLVFSYCRTRWPVQFAPRTKLKGFSPHEAHAHQSFWAWILPTIRTSEFTILQIVGLDAAVLLNFFKTSFYLFSICSIPAVLVLMPLNYKYNNGFDDDDWPSLAGDSPKAPKDRDWLDLISDAGSYQAVHLLFAYLFTFLALHLLHKNYKRFIKARQLYSLELVHSIAARTVMVTNLPNHLQGDRTLAVYFENMDLSVESVSVCREVGSLKALLDKRTEALLALESAWTKYVGNPSTVESYDPSQNVRSDVVPLIDTGDAESQPNRLVVPHRARPTLRPGWFKKKVDALEYLEARFKEADEAVRRKRKLGKFKATHVAFVTFEKMSSAQIAVQTVHASYPAQAITCLAPEPRDLVWSNMTLSPSTVRFREFLVLGLVLLLFFSWIPPTTFLASLLSYREIKKAMPWLGRLIDSNDKIRAVVQNSLPSVAMISLNGLLPFLLEGLTYLQGYRSRSWIEYSLLRKYFLFLLVNVMGIFLLASTYWQLVRDLANSPAKIPEKLATALQQGKARHFFLSYVVLQGLGIMPLQLLNLGIILPRMFYRAFITRTPRDFAELNAPPMINYGAVYPQAILVFVITITYSIIQPLILIFGAIYFGVAYVVYKYKLLFVFYKPYESQGQAWPITFARTTWGVLIFQVFMTGIFTLKQSFILSSLMAPLIAFTVWWAWTMRLTFKPLSDYVALSSVFEVQRGEDTDDVVRMKTGHPVTRSQSNLNRRRYAQNDETLYVAPEDDRTDYSQPPMTNWYDGVLNTGKRRYGHPALTGVLPQPWLPLKKGQTLANYVDRDGNRKPKDDDQAVVLTLRRRFSFTRKDGGKGQAAAAGANKPNGEEAAAANTPTPGASSGSTTPSSNPWRDVRSASSTRPAGDSQHPQVTHRLSWDHATGVIMLPEDGEWINDPDSDSEEDWGDNGRSRGYSESPEESGTGASEPESGEAGPSTPTPHSPSKRHATYYHHPERRRQIPGAFPRS